MSETFIAAVIVGLVVGFFFAWIIFNVFDDEVPW